MESIQHLNDSMNSRLLKLDETLTNLVQAVNNLNQNVAVFNANMKTLISEASGFKKLKCICVLVFQLLLFRNC